MTLRSVRRASDPLLAIAFVLFVTVALAGIVSGDTGATFTAQSANPNNTIGSNTLYAPGSPSAGAVGASVNVSWTATTSSWATGTRIYRATVSGGPYSLVQTVAGLATTSWSDTPGTGAFYYVLRAYYTAGGASWESANSAQVSATVTAVDHFSFSVIGTQHSGTAFNVTITAQAADNSTVSYAGTVALSVSSGAISPTTSGAFTAGVLTQSVTITGPYTTGQTITATGGGKTGTSNAFTLDHFRATAVAVVNKTGGVAGKPENGDTVVLTFSEAADTTTLGTCNGASNSGTDLLTNDANPDTMSANGLKLAFGTVSLGNNGYFTANKIAKNSTCAWTAGNTVLTITLQSLASVGTVAGSSTATWTPNAAITSATGEAIDATQSPSVTAVLF